MNPLSVILCYGNGLQVILLQRRKYALAPASVIGNELANEAHQKNDSTEI